jgi:hypothetical protein
MKRTITSLALITVMLLLGPLSLASAKDKDSPDGLSVPINGTFADQAGGVGKFSGTLRILRFAVVSDSIHAVGSVTGTLTDSQGNVVATGLQTVSLPITLGSGPAGATAGASHSRGEREIMFTKASFNHAEKTPLLAAAPVAPAQLVCGILRLSIGAIDLNLLGLTVHLNPVLLIINAVPGPGNLLGNLLCAIVNLLNLGGPLAQIVALLNQLLAILG